MASQFQSSQPEKTTFSNPHTTTRSLSTSDQIRRVSSNSTEGETAFEDPHSPDSIAQSFRRLTERISALDHQLREFSDECRQLGRSYALILAARALRENLDQFLILSYHNARRLSPLVLEPGRLVNRTTHHDIENDSFPSCLETVAEAFERLCDRLHEFHEYTDESADIKSSMQSFANDLKYRANCLEAYRSELKSPHIRLYIHGFADEMDEDLDNIAKVFKFFNKYGMPAIRYEQKRDYDSVLNMSTMATFFSAVTATTLQTSLSSSQAGTPLSSIVDTFWFCSLVLSIGAALNSLLKRTTGTYGAHWRRLPLWVTIWIRGSAPMLLTLSIACFSAGLVLFTYASNQKRYTSILTLVCTAVTSFGLILVSAWIAYEKWISIVSSRSLSGKKKVNKGRDPKSPQAIPIQRNLTRSRNGSFSDISDSFTFSDEAPTHITALIAQNLGSRSISGIWNVFRSLFVTPDSTAQDQFRDPEIPLPAQQAPSDLKNEQPQSPLRAKAGVVTAVHAATKMFWRGTARNVPRIVTSGRAPGEVAGIPSTQVSPFRLAFPSQPQRILKYARFGDICDLEYSPGGFALAVTSFNRDTQYSTTLTYYKTETDTPYSYRHRHSQQGRISKQVAWSPRDNMLLVRLDQSIDLFDTNMKLSPIRTIYRPQSIQSAAWCTPSDILSVEGCDILKLSLDGHVIVKYHFENLLLRDIAIVPNTDLILIVARVMDREMLPKNSRAEKQLILYDMKHQQCKSRNPLLDDMRHITIADYIPLDRNGFDVLVGHRNNRSPQVWTLIPHRDGFHQLKPASPHLQPFRELTGPGYFAGDRHQMISCVGNDGSIHIWDRESGTPISRIPAQAVRGGRRCIAWSAPQTNSMRFATVGLNEIKIWSAMQTDPALPSLPSRLPPITIPRVLPPDNFTTDAAGWDSIPGDSVPSPRSAVSVNIFDELPVTASDASAPYHQYSDTEEPPDIKVETVD